ncbi:MAG: MFS transporter [Promethearchaeota archaeon]
MDGANRKKRLSLKSKLLYAISSFGSYTVYAVFLDSVIMFYREKLLLSGGLLLLAFTIYTIVNIFNGVWIGWLSDRVRTDHGRRIPILRFFAPLLALAFVLIWSCPSKGSIGDIGVFVWLFLTMITFDMFYTFTNLAFSALGHEICMDNVERARIQVIIMVFGIFGTVISLLVPSAILKRGSRVDFLYFAVLLAIIQLVTMWVTAFTTRERLEFSHVDEPFNLVKALKLTIKNRGFITTAFVNFCVTFIQTVLFGNIFFYLFYVLGNHDTGLMLVLIAVLLLSGLGAGTYYILRVNKNLGLKSALLRALLFLGISLLLIGLLPGVFSLLGFFLFGFGLFGVMALVNTAFGAVADEDEVRHGSRREATIFGISSLISKPAQSLAGVFISFMLIIFRYREPIDGIQQEQAPLMILGFRIAIGIVPAIIILSSALVFKFYPLYGVYLARIKEKMYELHDLKKRKFEEMQR